MCIHNNVFKNSYIEFNYANIRFILRREIMKKTKIILFIFLTLMVLSSITILTSCDDKHTHNYSADWSKDGSYHWQPCSVCEEVRNKSPHDWNSGVITLQPTETSEGTKTFTCNTCCQVRIEGIPALDSHKHTYNSVWSYDRTHHWLAASCEHTNEIKDYSEHIWNLGTITLQPTASNEGIKTYTCNTCGQIREESIPALNLHSHTYNSSWSYNDTHHWYAASCEHTNEKKDYSEHSWNGGEITTPPTISDEGVKTYTCTACSNTKTESVPKLNEEHIHNYNQCVASSTYLKNEATCTKKATYYLSCLCGEKGTATFEYGEALGHSYSTAWSYNDTHHWYWSICEHKNEKGNYEEHNWDSGVVTLEPTTTSEGTKTFTCQSCLKTKHESMPKLEEEHIHIFNLKNINDKYANSPATCTKKATYFLSCLCGEKGTATFEHGNLAQHKFTSYTFDNNATCTSDGTKTSVCDICKLEKDIVTDAGSATGHSFSNELSSDTIYHWYAATCEHKYEVKDKEAHHWDNGVITKDPTPTTDGEKTYTCTICSKTKIDSIGQSDHIHTYSSSYSYDDNYHWYASTCGHVGETYGKAPHNWNDGVVLSSPTVYDEGTVLYTCQDCNQVKEEAIDKIPSFTVIFLDTNNEILSKRNYEVNNPANEIYIASIQLDDGIRLKGWYNIDDLTDFTDIDFSKAKKNDIYQFKPATVEVFEVVFIDYAGNQLGSTLIVENGNMIDIDKSKLPTIPIRDGYTAKWSDSILSDKITEDKIYMPVYEVITFNVTFLDSKNGQTLATRTVDYGSFAIIPEYAPYSLSTKLYGFSGWKSSSNDEFIDNIKENTIIDIYSDLTVYAVYEESITEPILAIGVDGTTVTISLCLPDNSALYSINMSLLWSNEYGLCTINSTEIANPSWLEADNCTQENVLHIQKEYWLTYNNKSKAIDFVWGCGAGHAFSCDQNTVTLHFGTQQISNFKEEVIFSVIEGSTIVYGEVGASIDTLKKSNVTIWLY